MNSLELEPSAFNTQKTLLEGLQGKEEDVELRLTDHSGRFGRMWHHITNWQRKQTLAKIQRLLCDSVETVINDEHHVQLDAEHPALRLGPVVRELLANQGVYQGKLTVGAVRKLFNNISSSIVAVRTDSMSSVQVSGAAHEATHSSPARPIDVVVRLLLEEGPIRFGEVSFALIKAALVTRNEQFILELRDNLQRRLSGLVDILKREPDSDNAKITEILVGNIVSLLPFTEPKDGTEIVIPQKVNGKWESVTYTTERVPLTPDWLGSEYSAYGFTTKQPGASPLLVFMGTTHPTATGARFTIWSDFTPFRAVGELLFNRWGKKRVNEWLEGLDPMHPKPKLLGMSLGGSLALLTVSAFPEKVSEVQAYSPPAPRQRHLDAYGEHPTDHQVKIYCQENDVVPKIGVGWHKKWDVYEVIPKVPRSRGFAHVQLFCAQRSVSVVKIEGSRENKSIFRKILNGVHELVSLCVFFTLTLYILARALVTWLFKRKQGTVG